MCKQVAKKFGPYFAHIFITLPIFKLTYQIHNLTQIFQTTLIPLPLRDLLNSCGFDNN
jgi:hypothetical protein